LPVEATTAEAASEIEAEADPMAIAEATRAGVITEIVLPAVTSVIDPVAASTAAKRDT
jgi:hypothetical protein